MYNRTSLLRSQPAIELTRTQEPEDDEEKVDLLRKKDLALDPAELARQRQATDANFWRVFLLLLSIIVFGTIAGLVFGTR